MGEGLAQGPYVAARGGVEPTTFRTEGTDNLHLTSHAQFVNLNGTSYRTSRCLLTKHTKCAAEWNST